MEEKDILEKASRVHEWMKLNEKNGWVQNVGTIWLNYMVRRYNEST